MNKTQSPKRHPDQHTSFYSFFISPSTLNALRPMQSPHIPLRAALLGVFLTLSVTLQATEPFTKITVASWNIGHFALGKDAKSHVRPDEADAKALTYRRFLDSIGADILAVVEYSPEFVLDTDGSSLVSARDAVFAGYERAVVGPVWGYNGNAIFSNGLRTSEGTTTRFTRCAQERYYLTTDILLGNDTVKCVSTHLDWSQGEHGDGYRAIQIQELIDAFDSYPYVILCADWNVGNASEYDAFTQAGYRMANHGSVGDLPTFPAGDALRSPLDNIIVKGFVPSRVEVYNEPTLSDHCLIRTDLTQIPQ